MTIVVIRDANPGDTTVIRDANPGDTTVVERQVVRVLTGEAQGPAGPQGPVGPAASSFVTYPAGVPLSGHKVVRSDSSGGVIYASSDLLQDANAVLGLSLNAALLGAPVNVQVAGEAVDSIWSFTPGLPVFLGVAGSLTQVPPAAGFQLIVGVAAASDRLVIQIKQPIIL